MQQPQQLVALLEGAALSSVQSCLAGTNARLFVVMNPPAQLEVTLKALAQARRSQTDQIFACYSMKSVGEGLFSWSHVAILAWICARSHVHAHTHACRWGAVRMPCC
jgi:hypothetical protein